MMCQFEKGCCGVCVCVCARLGPVLLTADSKSSEKVALSF